MKSWTKLRFCIPRILVVTDFFFFRRMVLQQALRFHSPALPPTTVLRGPPPLLRPPPPPFSMMRGPPPPPRPPFGRPPFDTNMPPPGALPPPIGPPHLQVGAITKIYASRCICAPKECKRLIESDFKMFKYQKSCCIFHRGCRSCLHQWVTCRRLLVWSFHLECLHRQELERFRAWLVMKSG